jgi:hypothetical protein
MAAIRVSLLGRAGLARNVSAAVEKASASKVRLADTPEDLVPSLAALIPKFPENSSKKASEMPWVKKSETFFDTWKKLVPCMPKYQEFLAAHKTSGLDPGQGFLRDRGEMKSILGGKAASEEVTKKLGEFYLHVALQLQPSKIEAAGSDGEALLKVAQKCAEEEFEPFVEDARNLVSDYDASLHQALEETCPFYEVDDGLFWRANFDIVAPATFIHYLTACGHGSGQDHVKGKAHTSPAEVKKIVDECWQGMVSGDAPYEPARRAAVMVYDRWLEASSMPVKADISKLLMEHGLLVSKDVYDTNKLMPEVLGKQHVDWQADPKSSYQRAL